ncbi:MAG: YqgE/AlgH family protein [Nitrococcus sp.]|nr:YqgE/AlgH family protein [Nitrococcus sp.]
MAEHNDLTNHFLIAMPALADPNFAQTVAYICEHNQDGALGIVINRPSELTLAELFAHMGFSEVAGAIGERAVYVGGPVQRERGFVLHCPEGSWDSSMRISDDVTITTSRDILEALARGEGPQQYLVALGYAGWGTGQLEREMAQNAWLSGPPDPAIIFERDGLERWRAAARLVGVDLTLLSSDTGHA